MTETIETMPTSLTAAGEIVEVMLERTPKTRTKATSTALILSQQPEATGQVLVSSQQPDGVEILSLTATEQKRYDKLKTQLRANCGKHYEACLQVGRDLIDIKKDTLYRVEYRDWQAFLDAEFLGLSGNYASRQMRVAKLEDCLEEADVPRDHRPKTESQARELLHVSTDNLKQVVMNAHDLAAGNAITANHFRLAAEGYNLLSDKPASQTKRAKEDTPKSDTVELSLNVAYDRGTGFLTLSYGSDGNATAEISLADLVRRAGIPESDVREALYVCFGSTDGSEGDEGDETTLEDDDWQTELLAA